MADIWDDHHVRQIFVGVGLANHIDNLGDSCGSLGQQQTKNIKKCSST